AIELAGLARILANRGGIRARRYAVVDLRPRATAVVRAPEVRLHVVDPQRVRGGVGGAGVEVAGLDVEDARPWLDRRRRHVLPSRATVRRCLDVAVVGAGPDHLETARGWRQRRDRSARSRCDAARIFPGARGDRPCLPSEVGTDA